MHADCLLLIRSCPWYNKCGLFGSNCGKKCKTGYVNDGCTCRQPLYVYAKKTYGRGVGVPLSCASKEEQSGALCYPPCKSGYSGVGPLCWSHCSGETTDTGADCLKKNYGRGVGKPLSCFRFSHSGGARGGKGGGICPQKLFSPPPPHFAPLKKQY